MNLIFFSNIILLAVAFGYRGQSAVDVAVIIVLSLFIQLTVSAFFKVPVLGGIRDRLKTFFSRLKVNSGFGLIGLLVAFLIILELYLVRKYLSPDFAVVFLILSFLHGMVVSTFRWNRELARRSITKASTPSSPFVRVIRSDADPGTFRS